jgi:glycosyltransferase involved in cell wall biosynthesis
MAMTDAAQPPLVSVIIPTKNAARYVAQALESVVTQGYGPLEILVVDGHSTDDTQAIVATFAAAIWIVQSGTGLSDAWNCGVAAARGELIAFLDSDDRYTPERLTAQVRVMVEQPQIDYSIVQTRHVHAAGEPPAQFRRAGMDADVAALIPGAMLARRALFARVGLFDTTLQICGDIDWFFRVKDLGAVRQDLPLVGLIKQTRHDSLSLDPANGPRYHRELLEVIRRSVARQRHAGGRGG